MTNKYIAVIGLVVVVAVFAGVNFVKSITLPANFIVENIENWYGGNSEGVPNENLGAIEFNTGKTTFDELGEGVLQERVVLASNDALAAIERTPIELVPDPGADKLVEVVKIIGFRDFSSGSFVYSPNASNNFKEGFEVKWGGAFDTASGMNGAVAMGASFSRGFVNGGNSHTAASPQFQIWTPSQDWANDDNSIAANSLSDLTSRSYAPIMWASPSSGVYLTASASFRSASNDDEGTQFWFRVIYRVLTLPQRN